MSFPTAPAYGDLSVAELKAAVLAADVAQERAAAQRALALAELDKRTGGLVPEGEACVPASAWLRHETGMGPGPAAGAVRSARLLLDAQGTADALASGRIRVEQATIVARALGQLDDRDLAAAAEPAWVAYAEECEPEPLRRRLRTWVAEHAEEQFERDAAAERDRRRLRLSPDADGMWRLNGLLDSASAAVVTPALEALARQKTEDSDKRSWGQRMCDALVEVCDRVMRHDGDLPLFGGLPPQVSVVVRGSCESTSVGPLPRWTLELLCCDADVSRVVLDPSGVVLDLGRASRVVNPQQRRVLVARDLGCVRRGCNRPPAWCDAHHLVAWEDGGLTDLNNLVLLCRRHHVMWHQGLIGLDDLTVPWLWALAESGRPPPVLLRT